MTDILKKKKIVLITIITVVIIGLFVIIRLFISDGSRNVMIVSGSITGLQPFTGEKDTRITFLSVVNPETAALQSIQKRHGEVTTYQFESSLGLKMVIVRSFDLESGAYYFGASPIVRASPGRSNVADVDMRRVDGDTARSNNLESLVFLRKLSSVISNIPLIPPVLAAEIHTADGAKPVITVVGKGRSAENSMAISFVEQAFMRQTEKFWMPGSGWEEGGYVQGDYIIVTTDEDMAKHRDFIDEHRDSFDQTTITTFTPIDPNFVVNVDFEVEKRLLYPQSAIPDTYDVTTVKLTFIDVKTGKIIAEKSTTETHKRPFDVVKDIAKEFVGRIGGTGPDAIELPPFTQSEPKPLTESASSWAERFRKIADEAVGGVGEKDKDATSGNPPPDGTPTLTNTPTPTTTPTPTPTPKALCNIHAFQVCANTFNLQGCIDACPYVSTTCPPGTPPNSDCKKTDQSCSNECWNAADTHIENCLVKSSCTKEEAMAGGGAQL